MARRHARWIGLLLAITAVTALTFWWYARTPSPAPAPRPDAPVATPLGWKAQLQWVASNGVRGVADGRAADAQFDDPYGLATDAHGTLYIADGGDDNRIHGLGADGHVHTLAGGREGFADGIGVAAAFNTPSGIMLDTAGNLYIADTGNHAIRKLTPQGKVTTLAGDGVAGDRNGAAAQVRFNGPVGVAVDAQGRVYVADTYNDRIGVIETDGQVRTLAGGALPGMADGIGTQAWFDAPSAALNARSTVVKLSCASATFTVRQLNANTPTLRRHPLRSSGTVLSARQLRACACAWRVLSWCPCPDTDSTASR
ncbi:hypothetical protein NX80_018310 [Xanthomonas vasicola pv. arecae]|uniref:hypothetical protein n=1 Tax=Xanthomonas vasicola TaxID=56459 RepID=UPI0009EB5BE7|nr:hypothetical protein [Xanthomonas vasicola]AZR28091.1 hypothetical protein NX80_018310 [Xanthomonas vasicola pv. arecae]MDO6951909.1 hypothetical protein [Xanthomonas vasicola]